MSIMNAIFGRTPAPVAPVTEAPAVAPESQVSTNEAATAPKSPMETYTDIWNTDITSQGQQPITFDADPTAIMQAASKVNFAQIITPEQLRAIQDGGQGAGEAFIAAMNSVSQTVFAQSTMASTKILEQALAKQQKQFSDALPNLLKKHSVSESLTENPAFNNPAIRPVVAALEDRLAAKYPNASSAELKAHANDYMTFLADTLSSTKLEAAAPVTKRSVETDWSQF